MLNACIHTTRRHLLLRQARGALLGSNLARTKPLLGIAGVFWSRRIGIKLERGLEQFIISRPAEFWSAASSVSCELWKRRPLVARRQVRSPGIGTPAQLIVVKVSSVSFCGRIGAQVCATAVWLTLAKRHVPSSFKRSRHLRCCG